VLFDDNMHLQTLSSMLYDPPTFQRLSGAEGSFSKYLRRVPPLANCFLHAFFPLSTAHLSETFDPGTSSSPCFSDSTMTGKDYEPEGEQDHISKLAFSAVAAPDPASSSGDAAPYEIRDLDQYVAKGPPATKREVVSYYAYVRFIFTWLHECPVRGRVARSCLTRRLSLLSM
jgi:hypothetical protein